VLTASVYITRAMAMDEIGLKDAAIRDYREALRLEPGNKVAVERIELEENGGNACKAKQAREAREAGSGKDEL
jgi:hypothetical protein